jgi:aldose 1-epimerase
MTPALFGRLPDGSPVELYSITNTHGLRADIINYGGIVVSLYVPGRNSPPQDIVLGFPAFEGYLTNMPYFGCITGRYANRIAQGRFTLHGREYQLARNNGPNHLHGGLRGFDKALWDVLKYDRCSIALSYLSKDGEEGYPGNLAVEVTYSLTDRNELRITYSATTDKPTVVNLTHHGYFNLKGAGNGDVLGHKVMINAEAFTPVDGNLIPAGDIRSVKETPFDFRAPCTIGSRIDGNDEQLAFGKGYDINFVLNPSGIAARVVEPESGRIMEVTTTEPGVQFYTGNQLDRAIAGKEGGTYGPRHGFCLETQHFPDSPNRPGFPSTVLRPGKKFFSETAYRFLTL